MSKRFLSLCSLIAVVSMVLSMSAFGAGIEAAPVTPGSTFLQDNAADISHDITERDSSSPAMYIVRLQGEPLASYTGGIPNLAATSPLVTGAPKLQVSSAASQSYRSYLGQQRQQVTEGISSLLGANIEVAYTYDVAFNGMALMLTRAQ